MKLNDLLVLANAGYTKEDITKLMNTGAASAPAPAPAPVPAPATEPATPTNPITTPVSTSAETVEQMLDRHFLTLFQMLQANAIHNANITMPTMEETVDDVLASIILPEGGNVNGGK